MTRTGTVRCAEFVVLGKSPARHQKIGSDPRSRSYAFYFFLFFDFAGGRFVVAQSKMAGLGGCGPSDFVCFDAEVGGVLSSGWVCQWEGGLVHFRGRVY
jgi:hypothetical protein